jgi:hypothetical protein
VNRRHFLAAVPAALAAPAIARPAPAAAWPVATPMMSDLIGNYRRLCLSETDPRRWKRTHVKMCRLVMQTAPFILGGTIWSAERSGDSYWLCQTIEPFRAYRSPAYHPPWELPAILLPDEQLSEMSGIPLGSRIPVPAWAFHASS